MTDTGTPALTTEQLSELLELIAGADAVEIKLTVPDVDRRSAVTALEMDPLGAQIRQVVFFDTPDLALHRQGVVVRARRVQAKDDDSVIKLRPVVPDHLPASLRASPNFGVEVDVMPGGFVCSGSMKAKLTPPSVREVLGGARPVRKLFTKEQRAFFAEHAPEGVDLDGLVILGPINVLKLKYRPEGFARRLVAELWMYPDGSRILELSTKAAPDEAFQVAAETQAYLAGLGVNVTGEQQTKTRSALEFFVRELHHAGAASDG